jgi:uncharacterized membrane protein
MSSVTTTPEGPVKDEQQRKVYRAELLISTLLRLGVIISFCVIVLGLFVSFLRHSDDYLHSTSSYQSLTAKTAVFPHTIASVIAGATHLRGQAIVMLGLLLLIATPVMRVAASILVFWHERDATYAVITSVVLTLLLLSFLLGRALG